MKASDLFVKCLESEGVEYIFGIPGEENIDLMDSLAKSPIEFVLTRHEQAAAFMADVYSRVTGKPGVCLATLGPGATNLITGVANAHLDRSSLVAITAQAERTRLHKESHQNVDTIQLFKGITKYDQQILSPKTIPEITRKAFELATIGSPGAVHVQLPQDVATEDVQGDPLPKRREGLAYPEKNALQEAAELIKSAKRPIILAGNGVIRAQAWREVQTLVEAANLPLVNTYMAKGILPFEHPRNLFTVGGQPLAMGLRPLHEADLIIAIGFDIVEYDPMTWNSDYSRKVLNIDSRPAEVDAHFPIFLDLIGNLPETLRALSAIVSPRSEPTSHDLIRQRRLEELRSIPSTDEELPRKVMWTLSNELPENCVVISDVGLHKIWVSRWYQPKRPGRTIIFNGFASMGGSLPGAIASRLAKPDVPVVVVTGDAGFLMNVQELETAKRLGLSLTVIIFADKHLSLIEKHQRDANLAVTDIAFTNPDFHFLANSFGATHRKVTNQEELSHALSETINNGELNLIEVVLRD